MSKYKIKNNKRITPEPKIKKLKFKDALPVILSIIFFYSIYLLCINYQFKPIIHIYAIILLLSGIAFGILNRGFSTKPYKRSDMPDNLDEKQADELFEKITKQRKISKIFLTIAVSVLFTFMFDLIYLYVFDLFVGGK